MLVDNTEALKKWLVNGLQPICDAEPETLATYISALIKKEKTEDDLRASVIKDLDVFLLENTEAFVNRLFTVLADKSYIPEEDISAADDVAPTTTHDTQQSTNAQSEEELSDDDRDHRRRGRSKSESPHRERSPQHRRNSPVHRRLGIVDRGQSDRRRGYGPSFNNRSRPNNNNRGRYGGASGASGPRRVYHEGRRERSRSPRRTPPSRRRSPQRSPVPTNREERPPVGPPHSNTTTSVTSSSAQWANSSRKQRCRDYDEKGYCMKGDQCEFDHGTDPVVMATVNTIRLPVPPVDTIPGAAIMPIQPVMLQQPTPQRFMGPVEPYNPEIPGPGPRFWREPHLSMGPMNRQRGPRPFMGPYNGPPHMMRNGPRPMYRGEGPPLKRPQYDSQHGQTAVKIPKMDPNNATLEIRKIPPSLNNIAKLNEHFTKFGTIVNLQVCYQGEADVALVTFSSRYEAKAAYSCPEPLFNNRFIKIFWHGNGDSTQKLGVKDRLGLPANGTDTETPKTKPPRTEPNMNPATLRLDKGAEKKAELAKKKEENHQLMKKKQLEIEMMKRKLLKEQLEQQKALIVKVEQCKKPEEKMSLMTTMKTLAESIERIRLDLSKPTEKAIKEQAAKNLLDTELEFHQKKSAGEETTELRAKLAKLKKEAASLGIVPAGRGRGGHMGRYGRGYGSLAPPPEPKTTALTVLGFKPEQKDEVVAHFGAYGIVKEQEFIVGPPVQVVVNFDTRHNAEVAAVHGVKFKGGSLILKWYKPPPVAPPMIDEKGTASRQTSVVSDTLTKDEEEDLLADEDGNEEEGLDDDLLLGDEEEDDEDKRVW